MKNNQLSIEVANRLLGVGEYYFSKKLREVDEMRAAGKEIINLGVGSPDRPPHPDVVKILAAEAAKEHTHGYQPYKGAAILRNAFTAWYAKYYGVSLNPADEVLPLIGSKEGVMHVCMAYLNAGDRVLIPNPGYPTYRAAVTIAGGVCVEYKLCADSGWKPDFVAIEKEIVANGHVKMMIVNYPHMPTGAAASQKLFEDLVAFAQKHRILLLHDNPYSFTRCQKPLSLMATPKAKEVALELNSLSKSHNMAGWRVGVLVGAAERIDEVIRFKSNMDSGMFLPLQAAAAHALSLPDEWYAQINGLYYAREAKGYELLDILGCTYRPEQAGLFVWASLPQGYEGDGYTFSDSILYDCGVFITPGGIFGSEGERYIRISLCAPEQVLQRAIEKIKDRYR
ncbi:MAG: aminotransferase class I/II-fold pyridoxal phosphate-dependent enzyme [Prevotellaceae bacterium]|jgi:aspartate/methionine/tyrosine aminotransferase|nr:aminotransferase class I/II-fold pyridoxal phosphate-dependent enzyme [Prevotellaceae bacterium]